MADESVLEIPGITREYLNAAVISDEDPTVNTVFFAMTADDLTEPADDDFTEGEWKVGKVMAKIQDRWQLVWIARILISGPDNGGVIELSLGDHYGWFKMVDVAQEIVRGAGWIRVI